MSTKDPYYFTHTVLFWMNEPENAEQKKELQDGLMKFISNSEYAKFGHIGVPAGTDREVVDGSYAVSLLVTFESSEDQDKYQVEPAHLTFIESCKHIWSKVQIYDSVSVMK
ncbi:MAG: Dabb family protein [Reichenbachiella sp.]